MPSFTNPSSTDYLSSPAHATQHSNENDEIVAIGTKIGTGASTPTDGKVLTGTGVGTSAYEDPVAVGFSSRVAAYPNTSPAFSQGVFQLVPCNTELYDGLNEYNTSTYLFTAAATGYYIATGRIVFIAGIDQVLFSIGFKKAGNAYGVRVGAFSGTGEQSLETTSTFYLTVGQTLGLYAQQNTGVDQTLHGGAEIYTAFFVYRFA